MAYLRRSPGAAQLIAHARGRGVVEIFGGVAAIQDVTLQFAPGSLTAIIGPNGAGKTTFFNLISGAIRPDKGRVMLSGEDIVGLPPSQIVRRGIARSFQIASIFPSLTVEAVLTATVQAHTRQSERIMRRFPLPECRERAFAAMEMLGLADKARSSPPISRTATRSCSISRSRWCSSRASYCSTSRPPAWVQKSAGR